MKIGILTLYYQNYNYGGQLQAYALYQFLESKGYKVEQISYNMQPTTVFEFWSDRLKRNYKKLLHPLKIREVQAISAKQRQNRNKYLKLLKEQGLSGKSAVEKFNDFMNQIPHSEVVDRRSIRKLSDEYDVVILGGDQIWNPAYYSKRYYGDWVSAKTRLFSYSVSGGKDYYTKEERKIIGRASKKINNISVRESNLYELLAEYDAERNIAVVVDPVFLLKRDIWEEKVVNYQSSEPYIFTYLLNEDEKSREEVKNYARKYHLKIVTIPHARGVYNFSDESFGDEQLYNIGPKEFLGLIKNAQAVITDSFHGTCFSIIFHKEFYAMLNTSDKTNKTTNIRLKTLLDSVGLEKRLIRPEEINTQKEDKGIDYLEVRRALKQRIDDSVNWLIQTIGK